MSPVRKFTDKIYSATNNLKRILALKTGNKNQFSNGMRGFLGIAFFVGIFSFAFFSFAAVRDVIILNPQHLGVNVCGEPVSIDRYCTDHGYVSGVPGDVQGAGGPCKAWGVPFAGSWGDSSGPKTSAICQETVTLPTAPSFLAVVNTANFHTNLTWTDNSNNETQFKIYRDTSVSSLYSSGANLPTTATYLGGVTQSPFADTSNLTPQITYYYRVFACNVAGCSGSNATSVVTPAPVATMPLAPTNLSTVAVSTSQINLTWNDASNNESSFKVYRDTSAGANGGGLSANIPSQSLLVQTLPINTPNFNNTGLSANTTYYYKVLACNTVGCSGSGVVSVTTLSPAPTLPTAPSSLAVVNTANFHANLTWTDNSNNETKFEIFRTTISSELSNLASNGEPKFLTPFIVSSNATSYSDTSNLTSQTTYYYKVLACNAVGCSGSGVVSVTTPIPVPLAPTELTGVISGNQIILKWKDNSTNETAFKVAYYTVNPLTSSPYGEYSYGSNVTTATVSPIIKYYRVFACNSAGCSASSNVLRTDLSITATKESSCQVKLNWIKDQIGNGYAVEYSTTPASNPNFSNGGTEILRGNFDQFLHSGIAPNTKIKYRYKVLFNNLPDSQWYESNTIDTGSFAVPNDPTGVSSFGSNGGGTVEIDWSPVTFSANGEKGYKLERREGSGSWTPVPNSPIPSTLNFYVDGPSLNTSKLYFHRIKSFQNDLGCTVIQTKTSANWVSVETPTQPTNFAVAYSFGVGAPPIEVIWSPSLGASKYVISGTSTLNGTAVSIPIEDVLPGNLTSFKYTLNNPTDGATYKFSVRGCNAISCSAPTEEKIVIVDNSPNNLIARIFYVDGINKKARVNISWLDNLKNGASELNYEFQKTVGTNPPTTFSPSVSFKTPRVQNGPVEVFDEVDLKTSYKYKVRATSSDQASSYSSESAINTQIKYILHGAAWSGYKDKDNPVGLGWLVMNSDGIVGLNNNQNWSVNVDESGLLSGVAWAEATSTAGYGWLSFNKEDLAGCPDNTAENCTAKLISSGKIRGWARFISPGFQGTDYEWVSLSNVKISGESRTAFLDKESGLERLWRLVKSPDGNTFLEKLASRASALFNIAFAQTSASYGLALDANNKIVGEAWNPKLGWIVFSKSECEVNGGSCQVTADTINTLPVISNVRVEEATLGEIGEPQRGGSMWCASDPAYRITWHYLDVDGDTQSSSTIDLLDSADDHVVRSITRLSGDILLVSGSASDGDYKIIAREFKPFSDLVGYSQPFYARVQSKDNRGLSSQAVNSLVVTTPTSTYPLISVSYSPNEMKVNEPVKFSSNITRTNPSSSLSYDWTFASGTPKTSNKSTTTVLFGDGVNDGKAYNLTIKNGDNQCSLWGGNVGGSKGDKPPRSLEEN
jgi:hypothetical protein